MVLEHRQDSCLHYYHISLNHNAELVELKLIQNSIDLETLFERVDKIDFVKMRNSTLKHSGQCCQSCDKPNFFNIIDNTHGSIKYTANRYTDAYVEEQKHYPTSVLAR